jgi:hypothetical protein
MPRSYKKHGKGERQVYRSEKEVNEAHKGKKRKSHELYYYDVPELLSQNPANEVSPQGFFIIFPRGSASPQQRSIPRSTHRNYGLENLKTPGSGIVHRAGHPAGIVLEPASVPAGVNHRLPWGLGVSAG